MHVAAIVAEGWRGRWTGWHWIKDIESKMKGLEGTRIHGVPFVLCSKAFQAFQAWNMFAKHGGLLYRTCTRINECRHWQVCAYFADDEGKKRLRNIRRVKCHCLPVRCLPHMLTLTSHMKRLRHANWPLEISHIAWFKYKNANNVGVNRWV